MLISSVTVFAGRGGGGGRGFEGGGARPAGEEHNFKGGFNSQAEAKEPSAGFNWGGADQFRDAGTGFGGANRNMNGANQWSAGDKNFDKNFNAQRDTSETINNGQGTVNRNVSGNWGDVNKTTTVDDGNIDRSTTVTGQNGQTRQYNTQTTFNDGSINRDTTVTGSNGQMRQYDTTINDPNFNGYRPGYYFNNGRYWAADGLAAATLYAAPLGLYAGWQVLTQPSYIDYPTYASYPVETAVEIALQKLGFFSGDPDGSAKSAAPAIAAYQQQNNLPVTGQITTNLLQQLGIQCQLPSN